MVVVEEGAGFFVVIIVVGVEGSGVCEIVEGDVVLVVVLVSCNEVVGFTSGQR